MSEPTDFSTPRVRLVRRAVADAPRDWSHLAQGLPESGLWRVTGPAGSGVTSLLVDTVLQRLDSGADPAGMLVITAAKDAAARVRDMIGRRLVDRPGTPYVSDATLVRPVHSVAFALLRAGVDEEIRLITGAEQDAVIRELLMGQAEDGTGAWPEDLRPALTYLGFARQLRDFLLRAAERGLGEEDLEALGARHGRPAWTGAGDFLREYRRTMNLAGTRRLSASELVAQALKLVTERPEVIERAGLHTVLVDDAQHLDPRSCDLVGLLLEHTRATPGGLGVLAGDPRQSIFRFRGASPAFLTDTAVDHALELPETRRHPETHFLVADSAATENAVLADTVRRAHLIDRVDWNEIAVVVRQAGQIEPVRRVLLAAGVPVHISATDLVLAEQPIVAGMILGVRALTEELTPGELHELVLGPVGGADPVTLRRLLRGLRRFDMDTRAVDTLARLIDPTAAPDEEESARLPEVLTERELAVLGRIRDVLVAGHAELESHGSVEEVLWALWQATGLAEHLSAVALRGGAAGSQADRDLDAMMALFDAAGDFVERRPTAGVESFVRHVAEQELPTGVRDRRADTPQAVQVLTAHATAGREWRRVVVTGVQDDRWPALGETGSLFEQEEFVDLVDRDVDPDLPVDPEAPAGRREKLAEERRLFREVAMTRATERLTVTAVDAPDADEPTEPSRFLGEYARESDGAVRVERVSRPLAGETVARDSGDAGSGAADAGAAGAGVAGAAVVSDGADAAAAGDDSAAEVAEGGGRFAVLSVPDLVAELRRAVCDPQAAEPRRRQAARQLARLAEAGVPGADPECWWSAREPSDARELVAPGPVNLSPSQIEKLAECPLRAGLERLVEGTETAPQLTRGSLVHAFAEAVARGVDAAEARRVVTEAFEDTLAVPSWARENALADWGRLLDRTASWIAGRDVRFDLVGVETEVEVPVAEDVVIRGRIDRLECERDSGDHFVVDLKTGRNAVSKKDAEEQDQLRAYQLALSRGRVVPDPDDPAAARVGAGEPHPAIGGAVLVFPGTDTKSVATREQSAKSAEELEAFAAELPALAEARRGPRLAAHLNPHCSTCRLAPVCPAQPRGRSVTDA